MPVTGFHSVIETPDSVRRVIPPTTTMAATISATTASQRTSASASVVADGARDECGAVCAMMGTAPAPAPAKSQGALSGARAWPLVQGRWCRTVDSGPGTMTGKHVSGLA
ncbi:hypothetical protein ACFQGS_21975 [Novosphingobium lubricantis]